MKLFIGIFVCIFSYTLLTATEVRAYDWTSGVPKLSYSQPTSFEWTPFCPTFYQDIPVAHEAQRQKACLFEGSDMSAAMTLGDKGPPKLVIAYRFDSQFRVLEGACDGIVGCIYIPEADILVTRFYTSRPYVGGRMYTHVSERIKREIDPGSLEIRYVFDSSEPDFTLSYGDVPLPVEAIASSENGRWVAFEYREFGIVLVDTKTFQARRILAQGARYGFGFDPTVEIAISNDGKTVAVVGERTGVTVAQITPGCGDELRPEMRRLFSETTTNCPISMIDALGSDFHGVYDPRFNKSGSELEVVVRYRDYAGRTIRLRSADYKEMPELDYLALGDSFSSGEGETDDNYYFRGTNDRFDRCHVSMRSYPFLLRIHLEISSMKSVACSGAKIGDIASTGVYRGQGKRLGVVGLGLNEQQRETAQSVALDSFQPGRILQAEFVERYRPSLVTIGIGGNDAGFMTKLRSCAAPGTCDWAREERRYQVAKEIQALFDPLVKLYRRLAYLSPTSKFVAIGYPRVIEPDGRCDAITASLLDHQERIFLDENTSYLNKIIESAARFAGVQFIDVSDALAGHRLCSGSALLGMNSLRLGDDISLKDVRVIGNETFHPTPYGHDLMALVMKYRYDRGFGQVCESNCLETLPDIPGYWGESLGQGIVKAADVIERTDATELSISIPPKSIAPGATVTIDVYSQKTNLAVVRADPGGGVIGTFRLPLEFPEGFHTVHIETTSYSGEVVELYQEFVYERKSTRGIVTDVLLPARDKNEQVASVLGEQSTSEFCDRRRFDQ